MIRCTNTSLKSEKGPLCIPMLLINRVKGKNSQPHHHHFLNHACVVPAFNDSSILFMLPFAFVGFRTAMKLLMDCIENVWITFVDDVEMGSRMCEAISG